MAEQALRGSVVGHAAGLRPGSVLVADLRAGAARLAHHPGECGYAGADSGAAVVEGEVQEERVSALIGLLQSASPSQTEFADKTVLKGTPQTFNAAFGLRRVGRDLLDTELLQSAAHLCGKLLSSQFLLA